MYSTSVAFLDYVNGHFDGSLVPVPARLERFGRVGQLRVPGRRLVGLWSSYAVRVTALRSPSVWLTLGTFRPCSRGLIPGPVRPGDLAASGSRGSRAEVCVELQVAYACAGRHAIVRLVGW